ncbi:hypothetical protein RYX36_030815 [Vicia faba]
MKDGMEDGGGSVGMRASQQGVAYENGTHVFTSKSGLHWLNETRGKQKMGRTITGVDAREGMGDEATEIGQRVGRVGNSFKKCG